jgi:transcriptional regulator with XRE-family HTH domain
MLNEVAGQRIYAHRVELGLSPEQFAVTVGVCGMTVRRIERGYIPFLSTQRKFAKALGVGQYELFDRPVPPMRVGWAA